MATTDQSQLTLTDITRMSDDRLREERLYAAIATAQMLADGLEAHARERAKVYVSLDAEARKRHQ